MAGKLVNCIVDRFHLLGFHPQAQFFDNLFSHDGNSKSFCVECPGLRSMIYGHSSTLHSAADMPIWTLNSPFIATKSLKLALKILAFHCPIATKSLGAKFSVVQLQCKHQSWRGHSYGFYMKSWCRVHCFKVKACPTWFKYMHMIFQAPLA